MRLILFLLTVFALPPVHAADGEYAWVDQLDQGTNSALVDFDIRWADRINRSLVLSQINYANAALLNRDEVRAGAPVAHLKIFTSAQWRQLAAGRANDMKFVSLQSESGTTKLRQTYHRDLETGRLTTEFLDAFEPWARREVPHVDFEILNSKMKPEDLATAFTGRRYSGPNGELIARIRTAEDLDHLIFCLKTEAFSIRMLNCETHLTAVANAP